MTVRLEDGARAASLDLGGAYPVDAAPLDEREQRAASSALRSWLRREGPRLLAGALETLRRRARRDLERMAEYYASLDAEMANATERARADGERLRRRAKWEALAADKVLIRSHLATDTRSERILEDPTPSAMERQASSLPRSALGRGGLVPPSLPVPEMTAQERSNVGYRASTSALPRGAWSFLDFTPANARHATDRSAAAPMRRVRDWLPQWPESA